MWSNIVLRLINEFFYLAICTGSKTSLRIGDTFPVPILKKVSKHFFWVWFEKVTQLTCTCPVSNLFQFKVSFLFHLKKEIRSFPMFAGITKHEKLRFFILISLPISDQCFHSNLNPLGLTLGFLVFSWGFNWTMND